jgi:hypothetical protein
MIWWTGLAPWEFPRPSTLNPRTPTLNPRTSTLNPQPSTLNPRTSTLNPQPSTLNPQPSQPQLSTLNPHDSGFPARVPGATESTRSLRCFGGPALRRERLDSLLQVALHLPKPGTPGASYGDWLGPRRHGSTPSLLLRACTPATGLACTRPL